MPVINFSDPEDTVLDEPDFNMPTGMNVMIAPADVMSTEVFELITPTGIAVAVDAISTVVVPMKLVTGIEMTSDVMSTNVSARTLAEGAPRITADVMSTEVFEITMGDGETVAVEEMSTAVSDVTTSKICCTSDRMSIVVAAKTSTEATAAMVEAISTTVSNTFHGTPIATPSERMSITVSPLMKMTGVGAGGNAALPMSGPGKRATPVSGPGNRATPISGAGKLMTTELSSRTEW
ncbi:hypothetical protein LQL77_07175 [Rhodococcus cerastii]|nr:hypothetical protein [Rhodococcus cerastii]